MKEGQDNARETGKGLGQIRSAKEARVWEGEGGEDSECGEEEAKEEARQKMSDVIRKGDSKWEKLHAIWREDGRKAGYVVDGGESYRVLTPSDNEVIFVKQSGMDGQYGSLTKGISNG
jgi:hypothetical protein